MSWSYLLLVRAHIIINVIFVMSPRRAFFGVDAGRRRSRWVCAFQERITVFMLTSCFSDLYSIIKYNALLPTNHADAAAYEPLGTRTLPDGQEATVEDICDFIVEYINSDVLVCYLKVLFMQVSDITFQGLLSDRHLIIAGE